MTRCENEGESVGNTQCLREATHRVVVWQNDDEYESFLCGECFTGFREAMIEAGLNPKNEALPRQSKDSP